MNDRLPTWYVKMTRPFRAPDNLNCLASSAHSSKDSRVNISPIKSELF
jgi:hypothetical protein